MSSRLDAKTRAYRPLLLAAALCIWTPKSEVIAAFRLPTIDNLYISAPLTLIVSPEEPAEYRLGNYRSPVPKTLKGATVLRTEQALELGDTKAAHFIDVLPRPPRPSSLADDVVWQPPKRLNIPGSTWLANVGFGILNPELEIYFKSNLQRISGGDQNAPLVFYCLAKCWMSWNAAKRALGYGYTNVHWYPDGTDGWAIAGGGLEPSEPIPLPD